MQNVDFYSGNNVDTGSSMFENPDPEYFSRMNSTKGKEEIKIQKKTNRLISLIIGLCIISFTTGLVVGLKFAGGKNKEIVDSHTIQTVNSIGNKVSTLFNKQVESQNNIFKSVNKTFPKNEYPYVIRIGKDYTQHESSKIVKFLKPKGHTLIISKHNNRFKVYTGPYKSQKLASLNLKKITLYENNSAYNNALIIKR